VGSPTDAEDEDVPRQEHAGKKQEPERLPERDWAQAEHLGHCDAPKVPKQRRDNEYDNGNYNNEQQ
jgi:hypothetical protein